MKVVVFRLLLILAILPHINTISLVSAQSEKGSICFGWASLDPNNERVVTGSINNGSVAQDWTFEGQADTYTTIRMEVMEGSLDPLVIVLDETSGQRITSASANDPAGRRIVTIQNLHLSSDGEYSIHVTRLGEASGTSEGSYRLSLEPGIDNILSEGQTHHLIYEGEVIQSQFAIGSESHARYFEGSSGQLVTIVGRSTDLNAGPVILEVIDPTGAGRQLNVREGPGTSFSVVGTIPFGGRVEEIERDGDWSKVRLQNGTEGWIGSGLGFAMVVQSSALQLFLYVYSDQEWQLVMQTDQSNEARIVNYALPTTNTYAILVRSASNPGNYELTLAGSGGSRPELPRCNALLSACPSASPVGTPATALVNEESASGIITAISPITVYQFQAFAGDVITINMQRTSGELDTFLGLADVSGNIVARDAGTAPNTAAIVDYSIPLDGCYFVYATRDNNSESEGEFVVIASGIPDITERVPTPPSTMSFGGDVGIGETISGEIDNETPQVVYRFHSEDEATITLNATRDSGDLAPSVVVLNTKNNQVAFASANLFGDASNPLTFNAEVGEYYFIIVQREGAENGATSGVFTLSVSG